MSQAAILTLFVGGGVANQIDFSTASIDEIIDALSNALDPPYYGDMENDHIFIQLGIEYYYQDYGDRK